LLPSHPSLDEFRAVALSGNDDVLQQFQRHFDQTLNDAVRALHQTYLAFRGLEASCPLVPRVAAVETFLFAAIDAVTTSLALLVRGWPVPAGNLMRQYSEATAIALLFSHPSIDAYDRWERAPDAFDCRAAPHVVARRRNRQLLDLDNEGWARFLQIARWYSQLSHASGVSVGANTLLDGSGGVALNGSFDPSKVDYYEVELVRRRSAADVLRVAMNAMAPRIRKLG
jgi:hypothetical protein